MSSAAPENCPISSNCLVCFNILENSPTCNKNVNSFDIPESNPGDRQDLFKVFCDYMELERTSFPQDRYTEGKGVFPFCKNCELMLIDLCELHYEIKQLESRASQIKAKMIEGIMGSSNAVDGKTPVAEVQGDIDAARRIVTNRYTGKVANTSKSKDNEGVTERLKTTKPAGGKRGLSTVPLDNPVDLECDQDDNLMDSNISFQVSDCDSSDPNEVLAGDTSEKGPDRPRSSSKRSSSLFVCDTCGKTFTQKMYLTRHLHTHATDEHNKKFICEYCGKRFRSAVKLTGHTSVHTGEKTFPCPLCPMRFGTYNSMSYHRIRVHGRTTDNVSNYS